MAGVDFLPPPPRMVEMGRGREAAALHIQSFTFRLPFFLSLPPLLPTLLLGSSTYTLSNETHEERRRELKRRGEGGGREVVVWGRGREEEEAVR